MMRHHTVQDKYLCQWQGENSTQLNIYVIPEDKYIERGTKWKGFWENDFNILVDEHGKSYLPEDVTEIIDTKGIEAIRKIDAKKKAQLSGEDRNGLAFYVALQYIRTPRHREEFDKLIETTTRFFMREDITSSDKVNITKKQILDHKPKNKYEEDILKQIDKMSEEEIKKQIFQTIHSDDMRICLTKTGHSKSILKVEKYAKKLFEVQWLFLVASKGTSFITSDNPCFTISSHKTLNGLESPFSVVIFPLRPDICIWMKPRTKSKEESFLKLNKKEVADINKIILEHSHECVVAKNKEQLNRLTHGFDHKKHRSSRDIKISKSGPYIAFSKE